MELEFIICAVFVVLVLLVVRPQQSFLRDSFEIPNVEQQPPLREVVPLTIPQKFRRLQQYLIRRENQVCEGEIYLDFKRREVTLQEQGVSLSLKEVELVDLANQIAHEQRIGQLDRRELLIEIEGQKIELKDLISDIQHRENLMDLKDKEISLDGKKIELQQLFNDILNEGKKVELDKKELGVLRNEMILEYSKNAFELEKTAQGIRVMIANFQLDKKAWSIQKKEDNLKLYGEKLRLLEDHIRQMYEVRMKWLDIQARDNNLTNREEKLALNQEKLKLQGLYESTQVKLRQLQLDRKEVNLIWDRRSLDNKWDRLKEIENMWYIGASSRPVRSLLNHG